MVQVIDPPHAPWITDYGKLFALKAWTGRVLIRRETWIARKAFPLIALATGALLISFALRRRLRSSFRNNAETCKLAYANLSKIARGEGLSASRQASSDPGDLGNEMLKASRPASARKI
jgi:hypothetical protein